MLNAIHFAISKYLHSMGYHTQQNSSTEAFNRHMLFNSPPCPLAKQGLSPLSEASEKPSDQTYVVTNNSHLAVTIVGTLVAANTLASVVARWLSIEVHTADGGYRIPLGSYAKCIIKGVIVKVDEVCKSITITTDNYWNLTVIQPGNGMRFEAVLLSGGFSKQKDSSVANLPHTGVSHLISPQGEHLNFRSDTLSESTGIVGNYRWTLTRSSFTSVCLKIEHYPIKAPY